MHITLVHIWVIAGQEAAFIAASEANRRSTRQEPGNIRFDLLRDETDPSAFYLLEIFTDAAAAAAHKQTAHYLTWREAVAGLMARPRLGQRLTALAADAWA